MNRRLITHYAIINGRVTASPAALRVLQFGYRFKVAEIQELQQPSKWDRERLKVNLALLGALGKRLN